MMHSSNSRQIHSARALRIPQGFHTGQPWPKSPLTIANTVGFPSKTTTDCNKAGLMPTQENLFCRQIQTLHPESHDKAVDIFSAGAK